MLRTIKTLGTLPVAATTVTAIVAVYISLVAFGNISDYDTNRAFVQHVLEMDTTFQDPDLMWRAITNPTLHTIAYIGVIIWETLAAIVLVWATVVWLRASKVRAFDLPRRLSTLGFIMILILFGGGFITIGGEWFAMWQSSQWNGLDPAIQNFTIAAFGLVLVHLPSHQWGEMARSDEGMLAR